MIKSLPTLGLSTFGCAIALTMSLFAMPGTAVADPNKWVQVLQDEKGNTWYVDSGSIEGKESFRYFWSYIINGTPSVQDGKTVYGSAFYVSVDCQKQRFRLRYMQTLDQNHKPINEQNYGESLPLVKIRPGTGEAASMKLACASRS